MPDQVITRASVPERPGNKLATTNVTNEIARAVNSLGQSPALAQPPRRFPWTDPGVWLVWDSGPNGEADYGDNRYWLRRAYLSNAQSDDADAAVELTEIPYGSPPTLDQINNWISATNLSERPANTGGNEAAGTHGLEKGTAVMNVRAETDEANPPVERWVFESGGGASLPTGEFQHQSYYMVSQDQAGWSFVRAHGLPE